MEIKRSYFCFLCGKEMEKLPPLPKEILPSSIFRFGCKDCNIVQERDYTVRELSLRDFYFRYKDYQYELTGRKK